MLVDELRPKLFKDIVGHKHIKEALTRIIKNPKINPRTLIFYGEKGTGKSSMARCFGNELKKSGVNTAIKEYDITISNKNNMVDLMEVINNSFAYSTDTHVLIFEEIHRMSKQTQSVFLKPLENKNLSNIYFIFTTTELNSLLPTIQSRCISMYFKNHTDISIRDYMKELCVDRHIEVKDNVIETIVNKSKGHLRDAIHLLDLYMLDKDNFDELVINTMIILNDYLINDIDNIDIIKQYGTDILLYDLNILIKDIVFKSIGNNYNKITKLFETYMKYKNYVTSIDDFIAMIIILKKTWKNT